MSVPGCCPVPERVVQAWVMGRLQCVCEIPGEGSSARQRFVEDEACSSQLPAMCRRVSVLAAGLSSVTAEALGVELFYDSLNVPKLRSEINKRDFLILGDSFQTDYCLGFRCSTKQSLEYDFCTVAQGFPQRCF